MREFKYDTTLKLGANRGKPRIWIEGKRLAEAGFLPGTLFVADFSDNKIVLAIRESQDPRMHRKVSGKERDSGPHPIIDMNTAEITKVFPGVERIAVQMTAGRIEITPARTILQKAKRVLAATAVALFAGAGLLSKASHDAGFPVVAANEIHEGYAAVHDVNHGGYMMQSSIEDARLEEVQKPVGLLVAGIPCEPYSKIRRNDGTNVKVDKKLAPEAHELGDMAYWFLRGADILNPHTIVLEEVPEFLTSGAGCIVQHALRRMGYTVDSRIINAADYGDLTRRTRAVIVATTFDSVDWPSPSPTTRVLADILHPAEDPACEWFTRSTESKSWLFDHWGKQKAKGNNLVSAVVSYTDATIGTIKKRYLAGQGDNQVVIHPDDESKAPEAQRYRWLTVLEIKRLMGLPDDYYMGDTKTLAGDCLGQGVAVTAFTKIIKSVTRTA